MTANGFPVTKIEKSGTHYDPDNGAFGTNYDLIHFLLPFLDAGWVSPGGLADIAVAQPAGSPVASGATRDFTTVVGTPLSLTFTINNPGSGNLTGLTLTKDGASASDFTVASNPTAPVSAGASTTFTIQFAATTAGPKSAALHIASNVAGKNPYNINLTGRALSFAQDTDGDGLSDAAEFVWRGLGFDWQISQPPLVAEFFANANRTGLYTASQVQTINVGTPLIQKSATTGLFTLTIGLQKSVNLAGSNSFLPFPFTTSQTSINGQGQVVFQFSVSNNAAFFRLQVQ